MLKAIEDFFYQRRMRRQAKRRERMELANRAIQLYCEQYGIAIDGHMHGLPTVHGELMWRNEDPPGVAPDASSTPTAHSSGLQLVRGDAYAARIDRALAFDNPAEFIRRYEERQRERRESPALKAV